MKAVKQLKDEHCTIFRVISPYSLTLSQSCVLLEKLIVIITSKRDFIIIIILTRKSILVRFVTCECGEISREITCSADFEMKSY